VELNRAQTEAGLRFYQISTNKSRSGQQVDISDQFWRRGNRHDWTEFSYYLISQSDEVVRSGRTDKTVAHCAKLATYSDWKRPKLDRSKTAGRKNIRQLCSLRICLPCLRNPKSEFDSRRAHHIATSGD